MKLRELFDRNKPWIKNPDALITVLFYDKIAIPLVYIFEKLGIHPNIVSIVGIIFGLLGSWQFVNGNFTAGSLLFLLWFILDCVDGKLARKTNKKTKLGERLDFVGGHIVTNFGYLSFVVFYFLNGNIYLSLFTLLLIIYHHFFVVYSTTYRLKYKPIIRNVGSYFGPFDSGSIILAICPLIFKNYWAGLLISNLLYTLHTFLGKEKVENASSLKNFKAMMRRFFEV